MTASTPAASADSAADASGLPSASFASSLSPPKREPLPAASSTPTTGRCGIATPDAYCARSRNLPSLTTTSTRARSSMPLWLVGLMLNTPWQPTTPCCCSSASRSATRNASVPGFAALQRDGNRPLQQQARIEGIGAEGRRARSEPLFVRAHVAGRDLLDRIGIGDVVDHQHRPGGEYRSFDLFLAQPDEVVGRHRVRLVDAALVALVVERRLRQHRGSADRGDQNGIGPGRNELQRLRGDAGIVARIALVGDDRDARLFGERAEHLVPILAVGVVEADEADGPDPVLAHVLDQRRGDQVVVLRGLEHPASLGVDRFDHRRRADGRQQRHLVLGDDVQDRQRIRRRRRTDDGVDVIFGDQLPGVLHGASRIASILELHVVDRRLADPRGEQRAGVLLRNADRRRRTGRRNHQADPDLRNGRLSSRTRARRAAERCDTAWRSPAATTKRCECYALASRPRKLRAFARLKRRRVIACAARRTAVE